MTPDGSRWHQGTLPTAFWGRYGSILGDHSQLNMRWFSLHFSVSFPEGVSDAIYVGFGIQLCCFSDGKDCQETRAPIFGNHRLTIVKTQVLKV